MKERQTVLKERQTVLKERQTVLKERQTVLSPLEKELIWALFLGWRNSRLWGTTTPPRNASALSKGCNRQTTWIVELVINSRIGIEVYIHPTAIFG